jgi:integrase
VWRKERSRAKTATPESDLQRSSARLSERNILTNPDLRLQTAFFRSLLDEIGWRHLTEWWAREIEARGRSQKTGKNYLDALSAVFRYAEELELVEDNPTDRQRRSMSRRRGSKRGRAESDPAAHIHLLEAGALKTFTKKSAEAGGAGHLCDMLLLDAGLRLGEAHGLRWSDLWWGEDGDDRTRALVIRETIARGKHVGTTKSGRVRRVAMSRRLRGLLMAAWMEAGRPKGDVRVLPASFDPANYRTRHFARVCAAAELVTPKPDEKPIHCPKDLRDTFASWLLTAGVQLGYVSTQLGHADVAVTARAVRQVDRRRRVPRAHGARSRGEVPADLLTRVEAERGGISLVSPSSAPEP